MVYIFRAIAADAAVNAPVCINCADQLLELPTPPAQPFLSRDPFALVLGNPASFRKENGVKAASPVNR
jgi:hypothetical protein